MVSVDASARRPPRPRRRRRAIAVGVLAYLVLLVGAGLVASRVSAQPIPTIRLNVVAGGRSVSVDAVVGEPVQSVLTSAGVVPRDGRLLSVVSGAVIDPHLDPAQILVDGQLVGLDTRVRAGQEVEVIDGTDSVEATEEVELPIEAPPMPEVLRYVHRRGRAGLGQKVVGVRSGEVVSTKVITPAVAPERVTDKVVALTFDDGPTTKWTPFVLQVLKDKGVHATFCQVGEFVGYYPELSEQVAAAGHELCNHTLSHDVGLRGADQARLDRQIVGGHDAFTSRGLPAPEYYRPPGGYVSDAIVATANGEGETVINWKVDTEDWESGSNPLTIAAKVFEQVEPGAIMLMHDGGGKDRLATIAALGPIIDLLRAQGYSFVFPVLPAPPT